MESPAIKLIALDLDGTLLSHDKTISLENLAAVNEAIQDGKIVVLASGRMHSATVKYAKQLDLEPSSYILSYNGAMARSIAGDTLFHDPIAADTAKRIVDFCRDRKLHLNFYLNDTLYVSERTKWSDVYFSRTGSISEPVGDLAQFDGMEPTKLLIIDEKPVVDRLLIEMKEWLGDSAFLMKTDDEYLEFMNPTANKGLALSKVAKHLGIDRESCLAMGDNYNDLPMLEWVGTAYAMANGREKVLAKFPLHAPAADDNGVAFVLKNYRSGTTAVK